MTPEGRAILDGLEIRMPMLLRNVKPLSEAQCAWVPAKGRNPIAWQVWHIAEVEDNWIRTTLLEKNPRFPFGVPLMEADPEEWPRKEALLHYLDEVRGLSRRRLEAMEEGGFARHVQEPDFGTITVSQLWAGVVTSFAWHAGQIAMTAKMVPDSPVVVKKFTGWRERGA